MAIICINEDGTEHDFSTEYSDFLNCKIGSYDGSRNAVEQFHIYLDSCLNKTSLEALNVKSLRLLDLYTSDDCDYVIQLIKLNPFNYQGGNFRWKSNNRKSKLKLTVASKVDLILHLKSRL